MGLQSNASKEYLKKDSILIEDEDSNTDLVNILVLSPVAHMDIAKGDIS
jgi:hypothetical protein